MEASASEGRAKCINLIDEEVLYLSTTYCGVCSTLVLTCESNEYHHSKHIRSIAPERSGLLVVPRLNLCHELIRFQNPLHPAQVDPVSMDKLSGLYAITLGRYAYIFNLSDVRPIILNPQSLLVGIPSSTFIFDCFPVQRKFVFDQSLQTSKGMYRLRARSTFQGFYTTFVVRATLTSTYLLGLFGMASWISNIPWTAFEAISPRGVIPPYTS